jgi:hypothetical protein
MNRFDEPQVAADVLCAVAKRARLLHELFVARAVDVGTAP